MQNSAATTSFGKKYAELYDMLHVEKDYSSEVSLILATAARLLSEPVKNVIDLACGTGRHAEIFSKHGLSVQINDLSEGMLAAAKKRIGNNDSLESSCEPMQQVKPSKKIAPIGFDLAVATYTAMGYLADPGSLNKFLRNLSTVLRPGGIFFADLWNGHRITKDFSPHRIKTIENKDLRIIRESFVSEIKEKNALQVRFEFKIDQLSNGSRETFDETHVVRYHTPCEVATLFESYGLEVCEMGPFMEDSESLDSCWNFFVFARKR